MAEPVELFVAYSHTDEALRDELARKLAQLQRQGTIRAWHDRRVGADREWQGAIDPHLETAGVMLLLVSAELVASSYCRGVEMERAMALQAAGKVVVVPVVVRACDWSNAPFARFHALPRGAKPVQVWVDRDDAWTDVANGIQAAADGLARVQPLASRVLAPRAPAAAAHSAPAAATPSASLAVAATAAPVVAPSAASGLARPQETFDVDVICRGRPVVELLGREGAFLVTDVGELIAVGPQAKVLAPFETEVGAPVARLALAAAAALDEDGAPVLGTAAMQVAWFRRGAWEVRTHGAAVLALGASRAGVIAGDSAGAVTVFDARRVPWLHAGEPVVELCACGDHVGALGAEGGVWVTRWPGDEAAALVAIDCDRVGRAVGLFAAAAGKLGVFGARRAGLVELGRGRITATSPELGEIRAIACHEGDVGYVVLGDEGELTALDATLRSPRPITLPSKDAAVGMRPAAAGSLLAWTSEGELFHVRRDGRARRLASSAVVLAYPTSSSACLVADVTASGVRLHSESWS